MSLKKMIVADKMRSYLVTAMCFISFLTVAQNQTLDSLRLTLEKATNNKPQQAEILNRIGLIYTSQGVHQKAVAAFNESYSIRNSIGDKKGMAQNLCNLSTVYNGKGDIPKALESLEKAIHIQEASGDSLGLAYSLNNIGQLYNSQGDATKALEYFLSSLKIRRALGDKLGLAYSLNNIGAMYKKIGDPSVSASQEASIKAGINKARIYFNEALTMGEEMKNKEVMAQSLYNLGTIHKNLTHFDSALSYFDKSFILQKELGDVRGMSFSLNHIGGIYEKTGHLAKAEENFKHSIVLGTEGGFPDNIYKAASKLYELYKLEGKHGQALTYFELSIKMRDSLNNEANRKASIRSQLKYEYEKQAAADSVAHAKESEIKNVELKRQEAEIKAKKNQQYALFGGLGLVMIFAGFMYNRFKITQKQKTVIEDQKKVVEQQKHLVEEKQNEILDSIKYARRIQMALIPSEKRMVQILKRIHAV